MSVYGINSTINGGAITQTEISEYGSSRLGVWNINRNVTAIDFIDYTAYSGNFIRGNKLFELSNHLQNVLVTISDKKIGHNAGNGLIDYSNADVVTANDYYPGGMTMPGRSYFTGSQYRYGFNGQEKSPEIFEGSTTAQFWEYDSRIMRRWNIDPVEKVEESPYLCFSGNPIFNSDEDGDDPKGSGPEDPPKKSESKYWYIGSIPKFKYNGTIESRPVENIPNAIGNGVINILNTVPLLWNSGVKNVETLRNGTWTKQTTDEIKDIYNGATSTVVKSVDYVRYTPLKQVGKDLVHTLNDPQSLETAVTFLAPYGSKYMPNIKVLKSSGGNVNGFTVSRGGYGAKPRFDVHPLGNASKKSNSMPKWTKGKTLPHYHRGKGSNLHRHRPWEKGWNDKSFRDRF